MVREFSGTSWDPNTLARVPPHRIPTAIRPHLTEALRTRSAAVIAFAGHSREGPPGLRVSAIEPSATRKYRATTQISPSVTNRRRPSLCGGGLDTSPADAAL